MKKKKLKKRIKRLEKEYQKIIDKTSEGFNAQLRSLRALRDRISILDDSITKNDQSYKSQFGTIKNSVREIRNMVDGLKNQVDVVKKRTETDYTQFSKPSCDTCRYNGIGIDGPCLGCTKEGLEMYKSKEDSNE